MTFTALFKTILSEMSAFLGETTTETLVTHGFKVGTAVKISGYSADDLMHTTTNTIRCLVEVMEKERLREGMSPKDAGQLGMELEQLFEEVFSIVRLIPPNNLLHTGQFSSSTVSNMRNKGLDGNYQTSKFLLVADEALRQAKNPKKKTSKNELRTE